MRVYKIYNTDLKRYIRAGQKRVWDALQDATRSSSHCCYYKRDLEIHGFEITKTSVRRNDNGARWLPEIAEVEENKL